MLRATNSVPNVESSCSSQLKALLNQDMNLPFTGV
jgi:hypothetical protein